MAQESERRAEYFLKTQWSKDEAASARLALAEHLLLTDDYYTGADIAELVEGLIPGDLDADRQRRWVQYNLIRALRDSGVLITSRSDNDEPGYKLIRRVAEAEDFTSVQWQRIRAMVRRSQEVRDAVRHVTGGAIDLHKLTDEALADLKRCGVLLDWQQLDESKGIA